MSERKAADGAIKGDAGRWWVLLFHVPWLSLVLLALLAAVVFGPMTRWEPWVLAYSPPEGPENRLSFLAFSDDGKRVLTFHWTGSASGKCEEHTWVRDCSSLRPVDRLTGCSGLPERGAFAADGTRVLVLNREREVQVFDTASGQRICLYRGHIEDYAVTETRIYPFRLHARFSPDGRRVASWYQGGPRRGVRVWDAATGHDLCFLKDQGGDGFAVVWSRDGRRLLTNEFDGPAGLWNVESEERIQTFATGDGLGEQAVALGRHAAHGLCVLTWDGTKMQVVDARTKEALCTLERPPAAFGRVRFTSDGTRLVTHGRHVHVYGDEWGAPHVVWWDAETGGFLGRLRGPGEGVALAALSPDGRRLITVGWRGLFRIHDADAADLLAQVDLFEPFHGGVHTRWMLSADARRLAYYEDGQGGGESLLVRRRPEWWWGVFWLPEFWLALALGAAFVWSAVRDVRRWRKSAAQA